MCGKMKMVGMPEIQLFCLFLQGIARV